MKKFGESYSLTYVGSYDKQVFWYSNITPSSSYEQVSWQTRGTDQRLKSSFRITLLRKEKLGIRRLDSLESLALLCTSIYIGLDYVSVGCEKTGNTIKGYPHLTNERTYAIILLNEEELLLRAHCDDVALAVSTDPRAPCVLIGGGCDSDAQRLKFGSRKRDSRHLLNILRSHEALQLSFEPPEQNTNREKCK